MLEKRRYKLIDGRLRKRWDATNEPGWLKTKAEALGETVEPLKGETVPPPQVHTIAPEIHTVKRRPGRPRKNV